MPFTNKDLQEAIGQMMLAHWGLQKAAEELQTENQQLKARLEPPKEETKEG